MHRHRMPMKNAKLEPLAVAVELEAGGRGMPVSRNASGDVQVELGNHRRVVVRDRLSSAHRGEGVTVVVSRVGDGTFDQGATLRTAAFDLDASSGSNVWRPEGQSSPVLSDAEMARHLLDVVAA